MLWSAPSWKQKSRDNYRYFIRSWTNAIHAMVSKSCSRHLLFLMIPVKILFVFLRSTKCIQSSNIKVIEMTWQKQYWNKRHSSHPPQWIELGLPETTKVTGIWKRQKKNIYINNGLLWLRKPQWGGRTIPILQSLTNEQHHFLHCHSFPQNFLF